MAETTRALQPGTQAPDFALHASPDLVMSLHELKGQRAILAFYPADWSPVCGDQMALYNELLTEFTKRHAALVGISVDGVWCHAEFARARKLHFPLLSDFEPKGDVARKYGVYRQHDGFCDRALFVLDEDGVVRWSYVSEIGVNPGADGILEALDSIEAPASVSSSTSSGINP